MTDTKHTPGPWHVASCGRHTIEDGLTCVRIRDANGGVVPDVKPNLTVMAAAPDLLDACKHAMLILLQQHEVSVADKRAIAVLENAIAKARGGGA